MKDKEIFDYFIQTLYDVDNQRPTHYGNLFADILLKNFQSVNESGYSGIDKVYYELVADVVYLRYQQVNVVHSDTFFWLYLEEKAVRFFNGTEHNLFMHCLEELKTVIRIDKINKLL